MRRGFTLIEMVVAAFLLAIGVAGALGAFASATRASSYAAEVQTATLLAQRRMSDIELQPDSLTGGDQEGDFSDTDPGYRWRESVEATDYTNLFKVTVTVSWGSPGSPQQRMISTYMRNDESTISPPQTGSTATSTTPPSSRTGGSRPGLGSSGG